jgi:NADPH-dependent 2,4-dienoyl-CoA reductase/sulfur reductase-like enzyme/nitrite reductase/ring-hydroxylating ferredoxin subunit
MRIHGWGSRQDRQGHCQSCKEGFMADMEDAPKPDLRRGFALRDLPDGAMVHGRVDAEDAILLRSGRALYAVGALCPHYHAPLNEGLIAGDTIRCPMHHACFSLRTGEALRAPALDPIPCWRVELDGEMAFVREKLAEPSPRRIAPAKASSGPATVVIIGAGAAGLAAADMLRREGYQGAVTMLSAEDSPPCDRPNLSKDFLAGTAPEDWMPLRVPEFYTERRIELVLNTQVSILDVAHRQVQLGDGRRIGFGAALIATGAEPVRLEIPGAAPSQIHYLRTFADSRAIVAKAATAKCAVVVGASFIGLEVAASLRTRGIEVHVVGPDSVPLERVLGPEVGRFVQGLHESHGVRFHLGRTVQRIDGERLTLSDGAILDADLVVLGVGVRPSISLAQQAGLAIDRGISVNEYLETSMPGVYAAGDVARWPDPHCGERIRVEHWVVAQRQGQVAARNILGQREPFDAVPFFWSQHYEVAINYVGHAEKWDSVHVEGTLASHDCAVSYAFAGRTLAVATISRDLQNLRAELALEMTRC